MKKSSSLCLCCALCISLAAPVSAFGSYAEDNPFVEAMLRMMEIFGLIDRSRLPLTVPYLPAQEQSMYPGLGGMPGMSPMYGMGGIPGMSPMPGLGGFPGTPMPGMGGLPGMSPLTGTGGFPGAAGWPGGPSGFAGYPGSWGVPGAYGAQGGTGRPAHLDGIWELNKGGFVIIEGRKARFYFDRDQYQDFSIGYDRQELWWAPLAGGTTSRYRYQMREGRMVLRDQEGNLLLLRRRR